MQKYKILKEYEKNLMYLEDILGTASTTNIQLETLGKLLFGNVFKGVFSSNTMPVLKNNEMCIVNTDDDKHGGTHWIACYGYRNKTYVYDSFDRDVKSLSKYWKHKHNWINANKDRDQSFSSSVCGAMSMSWLVSFYKYKTRIINIV